MNTTKILYLITTVILTGIFLFSASMYFMKNEMVQGFFQHLGFPTWLIYPLAVAKILAVVAIWTRANKLLLEWAYAGLFFDAVLAYFAHGFAGDGWTGLSVLAIVAVVLSRIFYEKCYVQHS